jgi:D-alanyl-D-alanine carboxypeptidase
MAQRYFIADNFDHYLALHKIDTTNAPLADIVAIVNVGKYPDRENNAMPCDTSKGNLMLVNGRHYLDEQYKPAKLVTFKKTCSYEDNKALPDVVNAFMTMQQDCKKKTGAQLMVNSAYRSYKQQIATHKRNDKRYVATAGHSEHQTGLAVDATSLQHPEKWSFGKSKEGIWMRENCHKYGFILRYPEKQSRIMGFSYEPWHLRYVGIEVATRIHDEDISFDEYYAFYIEREKE